MHQVSIPDWAVQRGRLLNDFSCIDSRTTALLVIDLQNYFMLPGQPMANQHACDIIPNVNALASAVRSHEGKVVWLRHTVTGRGPRKMPAWLDYPGSIPYDAARAALVLGKPTHALHAALEVDGADAVVDKYRYSALIRHSSPLERILKSTKIDTLIITGTLTNACCESTARDAHMMGYKVIFVSDATATITDLEHNATLLNLCVAFADIRTTAEVLGIVSRSVRQSN